MENEQLSGGRLNGKGKKMKNVKTLPVARKVINKEYEENNIWRKGKKLIGYLSEVTVYNKS